MSSYDPDDDNSLCVKGWGVFRNKPWHFDGLFPTETEAQARCNELDGSYTVKFGSHRLGTDDFILAQPGNQPRGYAAPAILSVRANVTDSLEHRFTEFLKGVPASEWLDGPGFNFPEGVRKADFLLDKRKMIAEIKTVTTDQQPKVDRRINKHLEETGKVVFGTVSSTQLFKDPAESDKFHHKILREITKNTEEMCRSANDQIAQTAGQLGINATGLLVILNESIVVLDPGVVAYRVSEYLKEKPRSIDYCLLVFETHEISNNGIRQNQLLSIDAHRTEEHIADSYIDQLKQWWAKYNGSEYIRQKINDPANLTYYPKR